MPEPRYYKCTNCDYTAEPYYMRLHQCQKKTLDKVDNNMAISEYLIDIMGKENVLVLKPQNNHLLLPKTSSKSFSFPSLNIIFGSYLIENSAKSSRTGSNVLPFSVIEYAVCTGLFGITALLIRPSSSISLNRIESVLVLIPSIDSRN